MEHLRLSQACFNILALCVIRDIRRFLVLFRGLRLPELEVKNSSGLLFSRRVSGHWRWGRSRRWLPPSVSGDKDGGGGKRGSEATLAPFYGLLASVNSEIAFCKKANSEACKHLEASKYYLK